MDCPARIMPDLQGWTGYAGPFGQAQVWNVERVMVLPGSERAGQGGPTLVAEGIFATTLIATPGGWHPAASLRPGTRVLTLDTGTQFVTRVQILRFDKAPSAFWPLLVPSWAMDNRSDVILLPEQRVLIETDAAEDLYGDPFAMIPARALEGWRGINRCRPPGQAAAVQLCFDQPQVIYASRGVLLSCAGDPVVEDDWQTTTYSRYSLAQAQHLVACLMAEETGAALREVGQRRSGPVF